MNITDVDDKTIKGSRKQGISLKEYTDKYTKSFFKDLETLRIAKAETFPLATDHIKEMVDIIKKLLDKGIAYKAEDGSIYYDISKFKDYGKLSHTKVEGLQAGARVKHDEYEKGQLQDFALWKAWDKDDGDVFWETILELDVTPEEYENLIEQAIKNDDKEFFELNNIRADKVRECKKKMLGDKK